MQKSPEQTTIADDLACSEIAKFYLERAASMQPSKERNEELQKAERWLARCTNPMTTKMQISGTVHV